MAKYVEVELTTGETVKVYATPSIKLGQLVNEQFPDPDPPVRTSKSVTGEDISMVVLDDPEYLRQKQLAEERRATKLNELTVLWALKDVKVPDGLDLDAEIGALIEVTGLKWEPRPGPLGKKLDYIEWVLLENPSDQLKVQEALVELISIDMGAVESIEESFRDRVEGETA